MRLQLMLAVAKHEQGKLLGGLPVKVVLSWTSMQWVER
jgi:hypothetical protein